MGSLGKEAGLAGEGPGLLVEELTSTLGEGTHIQGLGLGIPPPQLLYHPRARDHAVAEWKVPLLPGMEQRVRGLAWAGGQCHPGYACQHTLSSEHQAGGAQLRALTHL